MYSYRGDDSYMGIFSTPPHFLNNNGVLECYTSLRNPIFFDRCKNLKGRNHNSGTDFSLRILNASHENSGNHNPGNWRIDDRNHRIQYYYQRESS